MTRQIAIHSRRGAYIALVVLTLIWGLNWMAMKFGLRYAHAAVYNVDRILLAIAFLFAVMRWEGRPFWPRLRLWSWPTRSCSSSNITTSCSKLSSRVSTQTCSNRAGATALRAAAAKDELVVSSL